MSSDALLSSVHADGVTTITMHDGKANVMSLDMLGALDGALNAAQADRAAVVLAARGKSFSGGFDLGAFERRGAELAQMLEAGARLAARVLAYPRPVVAACSGHAVAMGTFLLLSADHRLCSNAELRIQLNEVQVGLTMPRFAVALCRQRLTPPSLHAAIVTARAFTAAQALSAGFVDELVDPAELLASAQRHAQRLAGFAPQAFEATKRRLGEPALQALEQAITDDVADWRALTRATAST
jgi:enoyl-CoA hydratase